MNIKLKKTQYNSLFEGLLLTVGGVALCGLILYGVLTNTLDKSNGFIIVGFTLFGGTLLLGLWKLINKKTSEYIDINGWKYKLFRKVNKIQFILITGGLDALVYMIFMFVFFVFNIISWKGEDMTIRFVLLMAVVVGIMTVVSGYIQYKKYSSIDMDSEFDGIFKP